MSPMKYCNYMPWPVFRNLNDNDILAIYTYLSSIPHAEPGSCSGPGQWGSSRFQKGAVWNPSDRTRPAHRGRFRNAAEQIASQGPASVRTNDYQVCFPLGGLFDNSFLWVAVKHNGFSLETVSYNDPFGSRDCFLTGLRVRLMTAFGNGAASIPRVGRRHYAFDHACDAQLSVIGPGTLGY